MSFKLSLGKVAITAADIYTNEAIMAFIDKKTHDVDIHYMYHYFQAINWTIGTNKAVKGVTLNKIALSEKVIELPPINIQHEIAERMDNLNAVTKNLQHQLTLLDELVKSRFVELFGDPVTNPHNMPMIKLKNLSTLITKGASPNWQGYAYSKDTKQTLFITSENVRENFIDISQPKYIENAFNVKQKRSLLQKGDVLINIVGASIGRAAKFDIDVRANIIRRLP